MQIRLLELLRCPLSGDRLKLQIDREVRVNRVVTTPLAFGSAADIDREIIEGTLTAETAGHQYPVVAGVPRMLVDRNMADPTAANRTLRRPDAGLSREYRQTVEHFRTQWSAYDNETFGRSVEENWKYFRDHFARQDVGDEWFNGKLVLDAGCGQGRYVDTFSQRGIDVIGLDIDPGIERVHQRLGQRANVNLVHGNVLYPPFERSFADWVFSNGVIHHTPDTVQAFRAIAALVRQGGRLSIWVYPRRGRAFEIVSQSIRSITTRLPRPVLRRLCYLPVPLLMMPGWGAYSGTSLRNSSWRECAMVVYDFFGPEYQTHHTPEEVALWYTEHGFGRPWFGNDPLSATAERLVQAG